MRTASRPITDCSMRGECTEGSIAGWAQAKSSSSRLSGTTDCSAGSARSSASTARLTSARWAVSRRRPEPMIDRRAVVSIQLSGRSGTPRSGQVRNAASKASASASSAAAMSEVVDAR